MDQYIVFLNPLLLGADIERMAPLDPRQQLFSTTRYEDLSHLPLRTRVRIAPFAPP
jgi:hypothetical protein